MYDTEVITNIIEDAKNIVSEKRKKYDKLMKIIEIFISENDIIVKDMTNYFFDLFTLDMFNLPMKLTNLLYESDPIVAKYVVLEIKIYKYHSRISIDGITFVHFTYINSEIRQNIIEYKCKFDCKCFGPEVLLINLYADLVNPSKRKEWSSIFKIENDMSSEIISHLTERIGGGKRTKRSNLVDQMMDVYFGNIIRSTSKKGRTKYDLEYDLHAPYNVPDSKYKNILLNNYICDSHVLIGQTAMNIYSNVYKIGRLQIITCRPFNEEIKILKGLLGGSITYSVNNLKIPTNLNLHKMTIYYEKYPIIDIYDAGNFELITYNSIADISNISEIKSDIYIGTPFVVMRFRLVDIWSTLFNTKAGFISKDIAMPVIHKLIGDYIEIRNKMNVLKISNIFPLKYIGIYEDPILNKMRIAARLKVKFIPPYIPSLFNKNNSNN